MKWRGIYEAVAVADTGSFTEAAAVLNTTVANVSRQVGDLEDRLAVKLFARTTRKVSPTELGETYLANCRAAIRTLDIAEREVSDKQDQMTGSLKITAAVEYGERVIAPILSTFLMQYPKIDIQLDLSNQTLDLVENDYDLGIRLGQLRDSNYIVRKIGSRQLVTCAAQIYLENNGGLNNIADLKQHNCLCGGTNFWRFFDKGREKKAKVRGNMRCSSGHALADAASKGLGIIQLPDYYVERYIQENRLVPILVDVRPQSEGIWAVFSDNRFVPLKLRKFIDCLIENTRNNAL